MKKSCNNKHLFVHKIVYAVVFFVTAAPSTFLAIMSSSRGDRTTEQRGRTQRKQRDSIEIAFDAELRDLGLCEQLCLCCCACGSFFDKKRSYLYLRENSVESNCVIKPCCGCARSCDIISVQYFDRPPFRNYGCCATDDNNGCCAPTDQPKFEVFNDGCLICCVHVCSDSEKAVIMPYEFLPFPCCCRNRVGGCDNCCGCCGRPTGNPKVYSTFFPAPQNAAAFVKASTDVMGLKHDENGSKL